MNNCYLEVEKTGLKLFRARTSVLVLFGAKKSASYLET